MGCGKKKLIMWYYIHLTKNANQGKKEVRKNGQSRLEIEWCASL